MGDVTSRHVGALVFCLGFLSGTQDDLRSLEEVGFIISGRGFSFSLCYFVSAHIKYIHIIKTAHTQRTQKIFGLALSKLTC